MMSTIVSVSTFGIFKRIVIQGYYSRHLYVWNLGEVHRNLIERICANKITLKEILVLGQKTFLLLFGTCMNKKGLPQYH